MNEKSNKISLFNMNNQSKTIIIFWFLSSLLIFFTALVVIDKTHQKISESYRNFGLMLTRTLASESIDLISGLSQEEKQSKLENYTKNIMKDNTDIEYIDYKNTESQVYFSIGDKKDIENKNAFLIIRCLLTSLQRLISDARYKRRVNNLNIKESGYDFCLWWLWP